MQALTCRYRCSYATQLQQQVTSGPPPCIGLFKQIRALIHATVYPEHCVWIEGGPPAKATSLLCRRQLLPCRLRVHGCRACHSCSLFFSLLGGTSSDPTMSSSLPTHPKSSSCCSFRLHVHVKCCDGDGCQERCVGWTEPSIYHLPLHPSKWLHTCQSLRLCICAMMRRHLHTPNPNASCPGALQAPHQWCPEPEGATTNKGAVCVTKAATPVRRDCCSSSPVTYMLLGAPAEDLIPLSGRSYAHSTARHQVARSPEPEPCTHLLSSLEVRAM